MWYIVDKKAEKWKEEMIQKYNITMKNIFSDMADDIVSYFLGLQYTKIDELNIEFARVEKRDSDMIFKCTTDKGNVAVHIEFQSENDEKCLTGCYDIPWK